MGGGKGWTWSSCKWETIIRKRWQFFARRKNGMSEIPEFPKDQNRIKLVRAENQSTIHKFSLPKTVKRSVVIWIRPCVRRNFPNHSVWVSITYNLVLTVGLTASSLPIFTVWSHGITALATTPGLLFKKLKQI